MDQLTPALDLLYEWAQRPEKAVEWLEHHLDELVRAEGYWDWDEGLVEVALQFGDTAGYWDHVFAREEREALARRAFLRILADLVEPLPHE